MEWSLAEIFSDVKDPKIDEKINELDGLAENFIRKYKNQIKMPDFTAEKLLKLFKEDENFSEEISELGIFCRLNYSVKMMDPDNQYLFNKYKDFSTKIGQKLAFLDLEVGKLVYENQDLISNPILKDYKHYLEKMVRNFPHKLSETEEQIILEKDQFGVTAWSQLQGTWLNTRKFEVEVEGELKTLNYGEANGLLTHPDAVTRLSANKSIYGNLGKDEEIYTSALRNICKDWIKTTKRRKYDSPMHQALISNDISEEIIENLITSIEKHIPLYQRYLKLKAKILKLPVLKCSDVVAPFPDTPDMKFDWESAKDLVLQAYGSFGEEFKEIVSNMFERRHIDSVVRNGKRNGAWCSSWYKGKSAFIVQSFAESLRDIYTLIHELGHAVHAYLSSKKQTIKNTSISMLAAETASTFGELLLTDLLLKNAKSDSEKMFIITRVLDGAGQAIFQVCSRVWFEKSLYKAIEEGQLIDGKTISKLWCAGRDKVYGETTKWFEEMDWEWAMKPHYFIPNFRFYNFPYIYAQLFVYSLYKTYQNEGKAFVPKLVSLLEAGGSLSPKDLASKIGLDVTTPEFWNLGMKQYEYFVDELEKLYNNK